MRIGQKIVTMKHVNVVKQRARFNGLTPAQKDALIETAKIGELWGDELKGSGMKRDKDVVTYSV